MVLCRFFGACTRTIYIRCGWYRWCEGSCWLWEAKVSVRAGALVEVAKRFSVARFSCIPRRFPADSPRKGDESQRRRAVCMPFGAAMEGSFPCSLGERLVGKKSEKQLLERFWRNSWGINGARSASVSYGLHFQWKFFGNMVARSFAEGF